MFPSRDHAYPLCCIWTRGRLEWRGVRARGVAGVEARTPKTSVRRGVVCTGSKHAYFDDPYWIGHDSSDSTCDARQDALGGIKGREANLLEQNRGGKHRETDVKLDHPQRRVS